MASKDTPSRRLRKLKRAAEEIGVPYSTLRDAHFRGELAIVKIGSGGSRDAWYVETAELDRWITSRTERQPAA